MVVVAVATALLLARGKDSTETRNYSRMVRAEVVGWNPETGRLTLIVSRKTSKAKTSLTVEVPGSFVTLPYEVDDAGETLSLTKMLEGRDDPDWEAAFCVGDGVMVSTGRADLQRANVPDNMDLGPYRIKSLGPRKCEKTKTER
jgi:hypothetical protein